MGDFCYSYRWATWIISGLSVIDMCHCFFLQCPYCAKSFVSHEYVIAHLSRRHGEHTSQVNGMVISTVPPVKSVGAVTMETKPGMTEKEKNDLEEELQMIKLRLQKTERELQEEKKLTQSQVGVKCHCSWVSCALFP